MGSDEAPPDAQHGQAVRFLTTLRSNEGESHDTSKPLVVTDKQREFLQSKGMSDDAIEHARREAERPENLPMADAYMSQQQGASDDDALFARAAHAFDNPLDAEEHAPAVPDRTYPRSPLALYSTTHGPTRDANEILESYASTVMRPRYDVLVNFFRVLHLFLMLGGGMAAIGVALYRKYVLPRLSQTIDARTSLLRLQLEQFHKLIELTTTLSKERVASLLPPNYEPVWVEAPAEPKKKDGLEADQGDEASKGDEEKKDDAVASPAPASETEKPPAIDAEKPALPGAPKPEGEREEEEEEDETPATPPKVLAPIDVTGSLRNALDTLHHTLRLAARAQSGERRSTSATVADDTDADDDGLMDLTVPESESSHESDAHSPIPPVAPTRAMRSLNGTMESIRNDVRARLLEDEQSLSAVSSRFSAYGLSTPTTSGSGPTPGQEMQQIKAEIRSLKGLMLSRRNFPSYLRGTRVTPSFGASAQPSS